MYMSCPLYLSCPLYMSCLYNCIYLAHSAFAIKTAYLSCYWTLGWSQAKVLSNLGLSFAPRIWTGFFSLFHLVLWFPLKGLAQLDFCRCQMIFHLKVCQWLVCSYICVIIMAMFTGNLKDTLEGQVYRQQARSLDGKYPTITETRKWRLITQCVQKSLFHPSHLISFYLYFFLAVHQVP